MQLLVNPENDLLLSPATYWELAIKISIGNLLTHTTGRIHQRGGSLVWFRRSANNTLDAEATVQLLYHHKDPFDRMLIAQAIVEEVAIVSSDDAFDAYPVTRLW